MSSDVYLFNASNDSALACNSICYTPSKYIQIFESDLATLPMFFAQQEDIVLVTERPSLEFCNHMHSLGYTVPQFVTRADFINQHEYKNFTLNALKPWGWSRTVHTIFRTVKDRFHNNGKFCDWNPKIRELHGRLTAANVLQTIVKQQHPICVNESAIPLVVTNIESIPEFFQKNERWVMKSPWSSSGRGLMRISPDRYTDLEKKWAQGIIAEQGYIMVEPWHDNRFDFSMLFSIIDNEISFLCCSTFKTNDKGQFQGSYIHWPINNPITNSESTEHVLEDIVPLLIEALKKQNFHNIYEGWMGVDAMLINDNGKMLIHPCVEINCRYTIGHVAYAMRKHSKQENALLRIGSMVEFEQSKTQIATSFAITPITDKTQFVGWIEY